MRADLPPTGFEVSCACLRPLMVCALIHLSDQARAPGELAVGAHTGPDQAMVTLAYQPGDGVAAFDPSGLDIPYRPLTAGDVQALAASGLADLRLQPDRLELRLARLVATTPLQIAPT